MSSESSLPKDFCAVEIVQAKSIKVVSVLPSRTNVEVPADSNTSNFRKL